MTNLQQLVKQGMLAALDFRVEYPSDWVDVPLPEEPHDFEDPLHMAPLAILMAPWAAVVFVVAARPAYTEGTVAQWLDWVTRQQGLDPGPMEQQPIGSHAAVACWGIQVEGDTVMRSRLLMFEDGERIVTISCTAPDALWASVAPYFASMLSTFVLAAPRGGRFALATEDALLAASSMNAGRSRDGSVDTCRVSHRDV